MTSSGKVCWITWEKHQRSRSLTSQLQIPLIELSKPGGRLKRYVRDSLATIRTLLLNRYDTVFVQTPSLVLGHLVLLIAAVKRFKVVADAHNAVIEGAENGSGILKRLYRSLVRRADIVIVTNASLAERVRALGGTPGILPDPVPPFRPNGTTSTRPGSVLVISTWASDEPIGEILQAARQLPQSLQITITGRPKGQFADAARATPNVRLSGFVSDAEYLELMGSAAVVVDLTTREDCLVCGAYEALALGRPLVVSDSRALRELLQEGAMYCENRADAIARTIVEASGQVPDLAERSARRREAYSVEWQDAAARLLRTVASSR